jgi:hypothetical protein
MNMDEENVIYEQWNFYPSLKRKEISVLCNMDGPRGYYAK